MDISLSDQAFMFLAMIVCGGVCGVVFDVFRAVRRIHKSPGGVVAVQDIVFWLTELAIVYMVAFKLNYAKVRAYEAVALVFGSWVYFMTVSNYVISFFCRVLGFFIKWIGFIFAPLKKLFSLASGIKESLKKRCINAKSKIRGYFSLFSFSKIGLRLKNSFPKKSKN